MIIFCLERALGCLVKGPGGKGTPVTYEVIGTSSAPDRLNSSAASGSSLSPSPRSDSSRSSWASCLLPKKRSHDEMEADKPTSEYDLLMGILQHVDSYPGTSPSCIPIDFGCSSGTWIPT